MAEVEMPAAMEDESLPTIMRNLDLQQEGNRILHLKERIFIFFLL
jgi:hypothetical protein